MHGSMHGHPERGVLGLWSPDKLTTRRWDYSADSTSDGIIGNKQQIVYNVSGSPADDINIPTAGYRGILRQYAGMNNQLVIENYHTPTYYMFGHFHENQARTDDYTFLIAANNNYNTDTYETVWWDDWNHAGFHLCYSGTPATVMIEVYTTQNFVEPTPMGNFARAFVCNKSAGTMTYYGPSGTIWSAATPAVTEFANLQYIGSSSRSKDFKLGRAILVTGALGGSDIAGWFDWCERYYGITT